MNKISPTAGVAATLLILLLLALLPAGCGVAPDGQVVVRIGAQNYAEVITSAYIAQALIEDRTDYRVEVIPRLGGAIILEEALRSGDVNIGSLLFTGGGGGILHPAFADEVDLADPRWRDAEYVLQFLIERSPDDLGRIVIPPLGWENTYAVTVRKETAEQYNLNKISDLKGLTAAMVIGMDDAYLDREIDGYYPLLEAYGLEPFRDTVSMQINLLYRALSDGHVDVGVVYSSDARVHAYDLLWLEDDLNFYPPYEAFYGVNVSLVEQAPEIVDILTLLSGKIDIDTIRRLNYEVDINDRDHQEVAVEFLKKIGLL